VTEAWRGNTVQGKTLQIEKGGRGYRGNTGGFYIPGKN